MPESVKPYAKAIVAVAIPLLALAVTLGFFDPDTGTAITTAATAIAAGLGVYAIPNKAVPVGAHERRR